MSLLIAGLAFEPPIPNAAKRGILNGSAVPARLGAVLLVWLTRQWQ